MQDSDCRASAERTGTEPAGFSLPVAIWSFSEALLWFVVPDVLLFALGVAEPKEHRRRAIKALMFSLLGTVAMGLLCSKVAMQGLLFSLPLTYPKMAERVLDLAAQWGPLCAVYQAWSLVPVKVWTWAVVEHLHWWFPWFLLLLGLGRGVRMLLFSWAGSLLGQTWPGLRNRIWAILYGGFSLGALYILSSPFR